MEPGRLGEIEGPAARHGPIQRGIKVAIWRKTAGSRISASRSKVEIRAWSAHKTVHQYVK